MSVIQDREETFTDRLRIIAANTREAKVAEALTEAARRIDRLETDLRAQKPVRVKCDGNHGGPPCADPECWNGDT